MKHEIEPELHGPLGQNMADAIQTCVHCGFCLPTCPTYQVLEQEMDSPRGRILLMKEVLEGKLEFEQAAEHFDKCLGCLSCETACPSQVKYGELISPFRAAHSETRESSWTEWFKRKMIMSTLPFPNRFRWAIRMAKVGRLFSFLTPKALRPMLEIAPASIPPSVRLQSEYKTKNKPRARVALLAGCAQQVLAPQINLATINVLVANDIEVVVPQKQGCCGALAWHLGDQKTASRLAEQNLEAFPKDVDAIITNAAGCGSGLHDYTLIFKGTALEHDANAFAAKAIDAAKFLFELGVQTEFALPQVWRKTITKSKLPTTMLVIWGTLKEFNRNPAIYFRWSTTSNW